MIKIAICDDDIDFMDKYDERIIDIFNKCTMGDETYSVVRYHSGKELLDNYKKDVTLEDVLIEPSSKIREDFAKQQEALDTFANKVREIRNENLPDIKTQNTNKPTAKAAINSNNNHR